MPFINGRFYINPTHGRAVEAARAAEAASQHHETDQQEADAHWVTIDGHHVLIRETQAGRVQHEARRRHPSSKGLDFIKRHEGYSDKVYEDSAGNPTIGYGHKILPGEDFSKGITEAGALALLKKDVQGAVGEVNAALKVSVSQNQFDALVSLAFNAGPRSVLPGNEMMRAVNGGSVTQANFTAYDKITVNGKPVFSQGLFNRRVAEYQMFSGGGP